MTTTQEAGFVPDDLAIPEDVIDNLALMFLMQEKLNDVTFKKHGITANDGSVLTTQVFRAESQSHVLYGQPYGPNSNSAQWMRNYLEALLHEGFELKEELPWKWWSKSAVPLDKARVEIVDMWHFLISITLAAGMTPNDLIREYRNKYAINVERQKQDYVARGDVAA